MNDGQTYAVRWIEAWNSGELDQALALWADALEFCSPLAEEITGSATLTGKAAAADYWGRALAGSSHLRFTLIEALWDAEARAVTILYRRERGADIRVAAEVIHLDAKGLGVRGIALHGAAVG